MTTLPDTTTEKGQREASVMLAELCGWHIGNIRLESRAWMRVMVDASGTDLGLRPPFGGGLNKKEQELKPTTLFNLYDPANMALAWRVLNWWEWVKSEEGGGLSEKTFFVGFGDFEAWMKMLPAEALRRWLDKILSLAVKEGMI